ncbi:MAG: DUF4153 domain-containing protein [Aridibacter sp.]
MNDKTKTGLEILQVAVLLGITGDMLLREIPWGLNVFLWIILLVAAMIAITVRRKQEKFTPQTMALHGALLFFSLMYVWRDSFELKVLNFVAIFTILGILTLPALKIKQKAAGIFHYGIASIYTGLSAAFAPFWLLFDDIKWNTIPNKGWSKHLISVIRGLAIAMPILFVFGALFMAADAVFQGIVENTFNINPETIVVHSFFIGLITWIVAGYLRGALVGGIENAAAVYSNNLSINPEIKTPVKSVTEHTSEDAVREESDTIETDENILETSAKSQTENKNQKSKTEDQTKKWNWREFDNSVLPKFFTLGLIEILVVLGLINLLFLAFVIVQVPYLFGGMDLVQSTPDFKLAEYARRGFGELVAVSALVLPILLLSHWLLRKDKPINEKIYRILAGIQIGLLFVIMISATQRLLLYTGNWGYGLTTQRFYPMAFMVFLALVFAWFAMTVLRGARQQFAWGTLWLALFVLGTLHVLNPDDFIVRTNINLMQQGRTFDANYNSSLSDDAVPAVVESMNLTSNQQKCVVKSNLKYRSDEAKQEVDFRSWNYSRWQAKVILWGNLEAINTRECPEPERREFIDF